MSIQLVIAGGGIAGLAAALACARGGVGVRVFERAAAFSEIGAGIQLGPNVTRVLRGWDLGDALERCAAQPDALVIRDAVDGRELARMALGENIARKYGAPYMTVHRADLQRLLMDAAGREGAALESGSGVVRVESDESGASVRARLADGRDVESDALVVADGVWTALRSCVVDDGAARATGHFAYRALASQASLPPALRSRDVTVWLAKRMHVVTYPLRGGEQLNVVALVESTARPAAEGWDAVGAGSELAPAMQGLCSPLHGLFDVMPGWGVWSLHDRKPISGPQELAKGRVALAGDAAHPMLPYLAQGAGMAIEDADALATVLGGDPSSLNVPDALRRYALARWKRCAQVQGVARRNAVVFHAGGLVKVARDVAMRVAGKRLLDQPWLYGR